MEASPLTRRPDIARISPELALVDPELARRVRRRVPEKRLGHRPPLPVLRLPAVEAAHAVGAMYFASTVVILILVSLMPPNRPDRWLGGSRSPD